MKPEDPPAAAVIGIAGPDISGYSYADSAPSHTNGYLWDLVLGIISRSLLSGARVFELGCGNGAFAKVLSDRGYAVAGVDPSSSGIRIAQELYPGLDLQVGSAYENLRSRFGCFDAVVSLEVIEHVYSPRVFAATAVELLSPGGFAIISTPFHGYWKNFALAASGKLDAHFSALWDHGHIKFWSERTLRTLLLGAGFSGVRFRRAGRVPPFAKSMVAVAQKPLGTASRAGEAQARRSRSEER